MTTVAIYKQKICLINKINAGTKIIIMLIYNNNRIIIDYNLLY